MERYIASVVRDLDKLDFVALSDVIDTMAQVVIILSSYKLLQKCS